MKRTMKSRLKYLIVGLVFLTGLCMMLYPVVSNWYIQRHQGDVIARYDMEAERLSQEQIEEELERARAYNESLLGNVVLRDPFDAEGLAQQNEDYENLLNLDGDGVMGSVEIPSIDVYLPIYHGTSSEVMSRGAGHLQNSSLPVGGKGTHAVVSAHTALPSAEMFDHLVDLSEGDVFYIHVLDEILAYQVNQIKVVLPENVSDLLIDKNEDYVTLVTCTPYGINSHRLLVRGTRIPYEEAQEIEDSTEKNSGFSMRNAYLAAGICLLVILAVGVIWHWRRKKAGDRRKL